MESVNPATGEQVNSYEYADEDEVEAVLDRASDAFDSWSNEPLRKRERLLADVADVLRERKRTYAEQMTVEMGKPISQAIAEVEKCVWVCDHYAEHAGTYLADEHFPSPPGTTAKTSYEPIGAILAVMPWNYPFWQVFRYAAPYITAGNVGVLKHASSVPGCALAIQDVFERAGYPEGVFQSVLAPSDLVDEMISDDRVKAATLTGSGPAGRAVASTAGEHLKKTVLELGGSDPFIVLDDADIERAAERGAWARNQNGGQSCIAAKRFVVHEAVYDEFTDELVDAIDELTVGDPMDEQTDIGPQSAPHFLKELHEQVTASVEAGAEVLVGGEPLDRDGAYYPPTVLTDVPRGCPASTEELFGPVATVERVQSEDEAVAVANRTRFGLGASVWTADRDRGTALASEIEAGCVYINQLVKSDPRVPFGGIEDSGYGRELSEIGMQEFVNRKTVWVE
ncbi:NAD-dependent succinate-semialdehyde dehydrogenase [Halobellus inordinatus]|uniref:NAD-dependent succinate-semialdehyde dehydrogenase n=1 Tax=Halobellus inordinatus TaxID=1126236 RepID=UPI00210A07A8|nr:NAD-dependent succinate-semialdehyde dehydrogenase [Halobellus inordinatus]